MFLLFFVFLAGAALVGAGFLARMGRRNALPIGAPSREPFSAGEWRIVVVGFGLVCFSAIGAALWTLAI